MRILFFDTETTGLVLNYSAPLTDDKNWPRLVELAYIVADENGEIIKEANCIIKPVGFEIPQEATDIHGISQAQALEVGRDLHTVLTEFDADVVVADLIVGHNIRYDRQIIGAEFHRAKMDDVLHFKPRICTMQTSTKYCNIPKKNGKGGAKWPSLVELYAIIFNGDTFDAHGSKNDVTATMLAFYELIQRGVITRDIITAAFNK